MCRMVNIKYKRMNRTGFKWQINYKKKNTKKKQFYMRMCIGGASEEALIHSCVGK